MSHGQGLIERQKAIEEVLIQLFSVLLCSGKTDIEVHKLAHTCIDAASAEFRLRNEVVNDTDAQYFGSILRTWHRHARYLTDDGYPRPLSLNGKDGLKALIGQYYPKDRINQIFSALKAAGLVKQNRAKRWLPTGKYAVFPHLKRELLEHLAEGVSRLVETVIGNVTTDDKEKALFERSAKVRTFPVSAAADFREFVNSQAIAFLGTVDDWMEARADSAKGGVGKKCTAGVFTFAFMDDESRSNSSRRRSLKP